MQYAYNLFGVAICEHKSNNNQQPYLHYTDNMFNMGYQTVYDNILNQICNAFLINFLLGLLQSKVLEKKPTIGNNYVEEAVE